jgi:hypothetical protein
MLRDERSTFLVDNIVLIIRVETVKFKLLRVSYPAVGAGISIGMPVGMSVRQAIYARRFGIRFGILAPRAYSVQMDEHVDDCT